MNKKVHIKSSLCIYITQFSLKTKQEDTFIMLISFRSHARKDSFLSVLHSRIMEIDESSLKEFIHFVCIKLPRPSDPVITPRGIWFETLFQKNKQKRYIVLIPSHPKYLYFSNVGSAKTRC